MGDTLVAIAKSVVDKPCESRVSDARRGETNTTDLSAGEGPLNGDTGDGGESSSQRVTSDKDPWRLLAIVSISTMEIVQHTVSRVLADESPQSRKDLAGNCIPLLLETFVDSAAGAAFGTRRSPAHKVVSKIDPHVGKTRSTAECNLQFESTLILFTTVRSIRTTISLLASSFTMNPSVS